MKPLIHFAHANGVPSKSLSKPFEQFKDQYDIIMLQRLALINVIQLHMGGGI